MRPRLIWGAGIGSLIVLDVVLDRRHDGSTLSECTRAIYRTHTPLGKAAFVASWLGLSCWICPHICKAVEGSLST